MPRKKHLQLSIFQDEASARRALEELRWPKGYRCLDPECLSSDVEKVGGKKQSHRDGLLRCRACRKQFTVTVGTVFHRSKVPLTKWLQVIFLEDTPGFAANSWQIAQATGLTHKTIEKVRARIYAAVGQYEGPNNIFGQRVRSYVRDQRLQSYQKPPTPRLIEVLNIDDQGPPTRFFRDFRGWYAWRQRNPLGQPIEHREVEEIEQESREDLARTVKLLVQLLETQPVRMLKKRRRKKADPAHSRWLPKKPKARPRAAAPE